MKRSCPFLSWYCRIPTHPGIIALIVAVSRLPGSEADEWKELRRWFGNRQQVTPRVRGQTRGSIFGEGKPHAYRRRVQPVASSAALPSRDAAAQFAEKKVLTLDIARKMVAAAELEAVRNHLAGVVAVAGG
jgi:hypothetical protein